MEARRTRDREPQTGGVILGKALEPLEEGTGVS
jgi:hypothetical protein